MIAGSAQLLMRNEALDPQATRGVVRIVNAAARATAMVRDLLDFTQARLGGGLPVAPRAIDLHALVHAAVDDLDIAHPGRAIVLRGDGDGRGSWDPERLEQVVQNLVTNALKYSPEASVVAVTTTGESDAVTLTVHNRGAAIAPDRLPRLFEPFERAAASIDSANRSVGLGLYIVDQIVRAHGGTVDVRSTDEDGTTFTVRLPRGTPDAASQA